MNPIDTSSAEHYVWGDSYDGWHLVSTPGLSVIQERVPPGGVETPHMHQNARQFFFVLTGMATMIVDGTTMTLNAGQGLEIAPDTPHQFKNLSNEDVVFLVISSPHSHGDRILIE